MPAELSRGSRLRRRIVRTQFIGSPRTRAPKLQGTSFPWMAGCLRHFSGRVVTMLKRILLAVAIATITLTAADNRIFELRTYHCLEGKLPDLTKRFREH